MKTKRTWSVLTNQNGGEYTGQQWIEAVDVEQIDRTVIVADGVQITFDEDVIEVCATSPNPESK